MCRSRTGRRAPGRRRTRGRRRGGVGPWARVAGGFWVASGREIPAGALIIQDPDQVLSHLDESLLQTQMAAAVGKRVVGIGELPPNRPAELGSGK